MFEQKVNYVHFNPVKRGFVDKQKTGDNRQ
jgi:hypothetical protein